MGLGADWGMGRVHWYAEARAHAILSDYGVSYFGVSTFLPLTVGVRF